MATPFIYIGIIASILLLIVGFWLANYIIALLASMSIIIVGVFMAINGIGTINNLLTQGFAAILLGLGAYVFINGSLQQLQQY